MKLDPKEKHPPKSYICSGWSPTLKGLKDFVFIKNKLHRGQRWARQFNCCGVLELVMRINMGVLHIILASLHIRPLRIPLFLVQSVVQLGPLYQGAIYLALFEVQHDSSEEIMHL